MMKPWAFSILIVIIILVAGCSGSQRAVTEPAATATTVPTETSPPPTSTPEPTFTPTSTPTPAPSPTSTPAISTEELKEKWDTPLYAAALTVASYEGLLDTADKLQAGEIDGFGALGELIAVGAILKSVEESLDTWEPAGDQTEYKPVLQHCVEAGLSVVGQWFDQEISSAGVPDLLADDHHVVQDALEEILQEMGDDGLSSEDIQAMLDELIQRFEEIAEE